MDAQEYHKNGNIIPKGVNSSKIAVANIYFIDVDSTTKERTKLRRLRNACRGGNGASFRRFPAADRPLHRAEAAGKRGNEVPSSFLLRKTLFLGKL